MIIRYYIYIVKNFTKGTNNMKNIEIDKNYEFIYDDLELIDQWILNKLYQINQDYLNIEKTYNINNFIRFRWFISICVSNCICYYKNNFSIHR